mmetsp:Transcript_12499/g.35609  ORF Transcript_12499/g.35609 Transcript_12499/m.35609 type:complete len:466 (-) Transcript_12499:193-1590(-)
MDVWGLWFVWAILLVGVGLLAAGATLAKALLIHPAPPLADARLALAVLATTVGIVACRWRQAARKKDVEDLPLAGRRQHHEGERLMMSFRRHAFTWTSEHIQYDAVSSWEQRTDASDAVFKPGMDVDAFEEAMGTMAEMPKWVDWELLDEGCSFFVQLWPLVFYSFSWALIGGFGAESASAVLLESRYWAAKGQQGKLDTWNRLRETVCWLFDVAAHGANGFREGGPSWKACLHVRFLHTRTRAHIRATGKWDSQRFGEPINQAQLVGSLLGSSILLLQGMEEMTGIRFSDRTRAAYLHLWAVIGFLFGIDEDINPNHSYRQAWVAMESVLSHGIPVSPDPSLSPVLSTHICESVAVGMRAEYGVPATAGLVAAPGWSFLGQPYGSAIGLPKCSRLETLMGAVRQLVLSMMLALWFLPGAPRVFELIMRRTWLGVVGSIKKRQPNCRFGAICPILSGKEAEGKHQ